MFGATIFAEWLLPRYFEKFLENNNKNNRLNISDEKISTTTNYDNFELKLELGCLLIFRNSCAEVFCERGGPATISKKGPRHKCFPVIFAVFLRNREYLQKTASENFTLSLIFRSSYIQKISLQRIVLIECF